MTNNHHNRDPYFEDDEYFASDGINGRLKDSTGDDEIPPELRYAEPIRRNRTNRIIAAVIMIIVLLSFVATSILQLLR